MDPKVTRQLSIRSLVFLSVPPLIADIANYFMWFPVGPYKGPSPGEPRWGDQYRVRIPEHLHTQNMILSSAKETDVG